MSSNLCKIPCDAMPVITETGFGKAINPLMHPSRNADFNVLIYLIDGEMEVFEGGIPYVLTANNMCLLKSSVPHWGKRNFRSGTSWYYIHFEIPKVESESELPTNQINLFENSTCENIDSYYITMPKIADLGKNNSIKYRMKQIVQSYNTGSLMNASIMLWQVLLEFYSHVNNSEKHSLDFNESNMKIKQTVNFINEFYNQKIPQEKIERELNLSYKYLSALFKEKTGKTIKQYQLSLRIKKAVELLCETNMPIVEISRQTGFYDEFYFSRIFKREMGESPLRFRIAYTPKI